jgi:hypothetical protein
MFDAWFAVEVHSMVWAVQGLIPEPPIELWPYIVARVPVPEDVEQELLLPLREEQN